MSVEHHTTYGQIVAYLRLAEHLTFAQLYDARRDVYRALRHGAITVEQAMHEAKVVNLAIELKRLAGEAE